jgi:hypothetical protein
MFAAGMGMGIPPWMTAVARTAAVEGAMPFRLVWKKTPGLTRFEGSFAKEKAGG